MLEASNCFEFPLQIKANFSLISRLSGSSCKVGKGIHGKEGLMWELLRPIKVENGSEYSFLGIDSSHYHVCNPRSERMFIPPTGPNSRIFHDGVWFS